MNRSISFLRMGRRLALSAAALGFAGVVSAGCLDRPVAPATPKTTSRVTDRVKQTGVDKIDLLFMIDNSASMADKAQVLSEAVPDLVNRLANPICVDSADGTTPKGNADAQGNCPAGSEREFEPINDIHIGIIDSSLGGHGADACSKALAASYDPTMEDMAHLIDRGTGVTTYQGKHFLAWDPQQKQVPPGEGNIGNLTTTFQNMVLGVGQTGCGFEASLESIYRFLVDPTPYASIALDGNGLAQFQGSDDTLLQERADFLRPDSLVSVLYLSDENDASSIDGGQYYIAWQASKGQANFHLPRATSVCATKPTDPCCFSCGQGAPSGCGDPAQDPECQKGDWDDFGDPLNLRAFHQKQRFGIDFLYPVSRYVDGLSKSSVADNTGAVVKNPLFADLQCAATGQPCKADRDPSLIFFAAITGVPWQDIAKDPTDLKKGYMNTADITAGDVWSKLIGDPSVYGDPGDPLMIESVNPRTGTNPATGAPLVDPAAATAWDNNPVNGHEWAANIPSRGDDLQYACIFPLAATRDCATQTSSCDCGDGDKTQNPLCQNPAGGAYGKVQYAAKAYPGIRALTVAKGLGDQSIVASICPANLTDKTSGDYGYRPAIGALIDRLKTQLRGRCLPRILEPKRVNEDGTCYDKTAADYGQVPCVILEARNLDPTNPTDVCDCKGVDRSVPAPETVTSDVSSTGNCVCQIDQLSGANLSTCQNDANPEPKDGNGNLIDGWCYVDPGQKIGSADLVAKCQANEKRIIRFVNGGKAVNGSTLFITCQEGAYNPSAGAEGGVDPCP